MGLVDYSESDSSDAEAPSAPTTVPAKSDAQPTSKKPFQKVVDRTNSGKILVSLPQSSPSQASNPDGGDEPPAKRARTAGTGKFSGFNSSLPAPKNANKKPISGPSASTSSSARVGINLKTGAAPGFSRDGHGKQDGEEGPPAVKSTQPAPSIPDDQKPAEEVKLVGKPLMFKPLSVARGSKTKKKPISSTAASATFHQAEAVNGIGAGSQAGRGQAGEPASAPKKVSLFSMHLDEEAPIGPNQSMAPYEPMFDTGAAIDPTSDPTQYGSHALNEPPVITESESLDTIADNLHLSVAERRELFGRGGGSLAAKKVVNFNMDREYQHNEGIRAQGDQQIHNPVRALQGGKHSLRQLVQNVHNQREALEESFAKGKSNRREASSKYGW